MWLIAVGNRTASSLQTVSLQDRVLIRIAVTGIGANDLVGTLDLFHRIFEWHRAGHLGFSVAREGLEELIGEIGRAHV